MKSIILQFLKDTIYLSIFKTVSGSIISITIPFIGKTHKSKLYGYQLYNQKIHKQKIHQKCRTFKGRKKQWKSLPQDEKDILIKLCIIYEKEGQAVVTEDDKLTHIELITLEEKGIIISNDVCDYHVTKYPLFSNGLGNNSNINFFKCLLMEWAVKMVKENNPDLNI